MPAGRRRTGAEVPALDIIDDVNQQHDRSIGVNRGAKTTVGGYDEATERNFTACGPSCEAAAKRPIVGLFRDGPARPHEARERIKRCANPSVLEASGYGFPL